MTEECEGGERKKEEREKEETEWKEAGRNEVEEKEAGTRKAKMYPAPAIFQKHESPLC